MAAPQISMILLLPQEHLIKDNLQRHLRQHLRQRRLARHNQHRAQWQHLVKMRVNQKKHLKKLWAQARQRQFLEQGQRQRQAQQPVQ